MKVYVIFESIGSKNGKLGLGEGILIGFIVQNFKRNYFVLINISHFNKINNLFHYLLVLLEIKIYW